MNTTLVDSPFHFAEKEIQQRLGVRNKMEAIGQRVIRDHMPEQHRQFYQQLEYIFVGSVDTQLKPWASILFNPIGFIQSCDSKTLEINASTVKGDPLEHITKGAPIGILGIELDTRRRNRLSANLTEKQSGKLTLSIQQTFGNCPKYISPKKVIPHSDWRNRTTQAGGLNKLDAMAIELISQADTFFVASYCPDLASDNSKAKGVDVSHRGGAQGFINIETPNRLLIPDYIGNNFFNTLGNIEASGKAGLLFIDFARGHLLSLTGQAQILWDSPRVHQFSDAQRLWQFELETGFWFFNALPFSLDII